MSNSTPNKGFVWGGRVVSALPVLGLALSAVMKLTHNPNLVPVFVGHLGYPEGALLPIGIIELVAALLYAIPRTSVFGAVLATAYLGGAAATHVRIGESPHAAIILGILVWLGLFLRDERLRALVPLRKPAV